MVDGGSPALRTAAVAAVAAALVLPAACGSSTGPAPGAAPSSTVGATPSPATPAPVTTLGGFPAIPQRALPAPVATSLQAAVDAAVRSGSIRGATAGVIVAGAGSWSGAAGVDSEGRALTASSALVTASVGKTITAAQVLRLVEDGKLNLEDEVSDRFPPELASFDAKGATVRDVLGMRSGLMDPPLYEDLVDQGERTKDLVEIPIDFRHPGESGAPPDLATSMRFFFVVSTPGPCQGHQDATNFYVWSAVTDKGRVSGWDFAPDNAWLRMG